MTIDWTVPQVEIDARVVLREGCLELLICAVNTKEHESILATAARPRQIFEALGLIGLTPGNPPSFDPARDAYTPPRGQQLALEIAWQQEGQPKVVAAHEWMMTADAHQPAGPLPWLFCGSRETGGRFAAEVEGTIGCVVDFDTALIGLADRHSSSDAELWLTANTAAIPERGTECRLIVRALSEEPIRVTLTPERMFEWNGTVLDALELDQLIKDRIRHAPQQQLELSVMDGVPAPIARLAAVAIVGSGIKRENLVLNLPDSLLNPPASQPAEPAPAPPPPN